MLIIKKDLYQFNEYAAPIDLTFNQYLLMTDEPVLFHTGNAQQAKTLIPQLKEALGSKDLNYIFVSHFESDECGGLSLILESFPNARTICPEVTARQFMGFGYEYDFIIKQPGEKLIANAYELEFINYPSEMHLWDGLLVIENKRRIFFSSDLMMRFGKYKGKILDSGWNDEINNIKQEQVPDPRKLEILQEKLKQFNPDFVAAGHGPCLKLK